MGVIELYKSILQLIRGENGQISLLVKNFSNLPLIMK